jgi:hypothetical protein
MKNLVPPNSHPALDRFSRTNPGPLVSFGTVRGTFLSMLERYGLEEVRTFWRSLPILHEGGFLPEAEGYRFLWEHRDKVHAYYLEEVNEALMEFLLRRGESHLDFFDERHFRFEHGGIWSNEENLNWIRKDLEDFYTTEDLMGTMLQFACQWAMKAVPGALCQIPLTVRKGNKVRSIFAFAPDGSYRYRCPYLFSRSTLMGLKMFPRFVGLTVFEEARILADCLHPGQILRGVEWDIQDGIFLIEGAPYGRVGRFKDWALEREIEFKGPPIPDRDIVRMERAFKCPIRKIEVLSEGSVYDAPLFLANVGYHQAFSSGSSRDFLKNIVEGLSRQNQDGWSDIESAYSSLLGIAERKVRVEYRRTSQTILVDGKTLIAGIPAMILRKVLVAHINGQGRFYFRTFKHDRELFNDYKQTSFETRWKRLRERLEAEADLHIRLEKSGRGEFILRLERALDFREGP